MKLAAPGQESSARRQGNPAQCCRRYEAYWNGELSILRYTHTYIIYIIYYICMMMMNAHGMKYGRIRDSGALRK